LDNDLIIKQFDEIEHRIGRLLNHVKSLETLNAQLTFSVSQLEEELKVRVETEKKYTEEKAFVRARIDDLVAKLKDVSGL
jgi:two-component sensor histidine kinase